MSEEKDVIMDVKVKRGRSRRKRADAKETSVARETTVRESVTVHKEIAAPKPVVLIAKKDKRVILAPTKKSKRPTRKAFRSKKIYMLIDNTRKTQRRRESILETIDNLSDAQARVKAVDANLVRPEKIALIPITLVKSLLKGIRELKID